MRWVTLCRQNDLLENAGVAAMYEDIHGDKHQLALFSLVQAGNVRIFATGNWDPIGRANVLSRGILGSVGDEPVVASPLYKQHFSLINGQCLEQPDCSVPVYALRLEGDWVQVAEQDVI